MLETLSLILRIALEIVQFKKIKNVPDSQI